MQAAAAAAAVAPSQLLSDFSLWEMVRLRPGQPAALAHCQGCSELFVRTNGQVGRHAAAAGGAA
jgi:ribonuclease D